MNGLSSAIAAQHKIAVYYEFSHIFFHAFSHKNMILTESCAMHGDFDDATTHNKLHCVQTIFFVISREYLRGTGL